MRLTPHPRCGSVSARPRLAAVLSLLAGGLVSACGDSRSDYQKGLDKIQQDYAVRQQQAALSSLARAEQSDRDWDKSQGPATEGLAVCKAAVGIVMGHAPGGMKGSALGENEFAVSYRRDDGTRWTYHCNVTSSRVRWATSENGNQGPWRGDENFRYAVGGKVLTVTSSSMDDGKDVVARYALPSLREL